MEDSYAGRTGADFDSLMDEVAAACADEDSEALGRLYRQMAVPAALLL